MDTDHNEIVPDHISRDLQLCINEATRRLECQDERTVLVCPKANANFSAMFSPVKPHNMECAEDLAFALETASNPRHAAGMEFKTETARFEHTSCKTDLRCQ